MAANSIHGCALAPRHPRHSFPDPPPDGQFEHVNVAAEQGSQMGFGGEPPSAQFLYKKRRCPGVFFTACAPGVLRTAL
eukprot:3873626-Prymnesium_polylepis.1